MFQPPSRSEMLLNQIHSELVDTRKAQLKNASQVIASQERVASQIDSQLANINDTLLEMGSMINWHLSNVVWLLEQQNDYLAQILATLKAPLGTKALELRQRAETAFQNGWYEEALTDFLKSEETNPYDFVVHQFIGLIYLTNQQLDDALNYFRKAVKFAAPKSTYYASYAQLFVARVHRLRGEWDSGILATAEAVSLGTEFSEAYYQHAVSWALANNLEESIDWLKSSFYLDPYYTLKAPLDPELEYVHPELPHLFEELREESEKEAEIKLAHAEKSYLLTEHHNRTGVTLEKAREFFNRNSYLDFLDCLVKSYETLESAENFTQAKTAEVKQKRASYSVSKVLSEALVLDSGSWTPALVALGIVIWLLGALINWIFNTNWVQTQGLRIVYLGLGILLINVVLAVVMPGYYGSLEKKWSDAYQQITKFGQ